MSFHVTHNPLPGAKVDINLPVVPLNVTRGGSDYTCAQRSTGVMKSYPHTPGAPLGNVEGVARALLHPYESATSGLLACSEDTEGVDEPISSFAVFFCG